MTTVVLSRPAAHRPARLPRLLCCAALLLCGLLALAQPARALEITSDTTINYAIDDNVFVIGSPKVALVSGGSVGKFLLAFDSSTVTVSGGSIGYSLFANNSSTVNLSGGSIAGNLVAFDSSTVNLSGGSIGDFLAVVGPSAALNVYGTNLRLDGPFTTESGDMYYTLSGTLQDGTAINTPVYLFNGAQVSQIVLHETNPLPALKAQVQALVTAGTLSRGNANALLVKLDAAETALAAGNTVQATAALNDFLNQVRAFVRTGKLSAAQGDALIAAAQAILSGIRSGGGAIG